VVTSLKVAVRKKVAFALILISLTALCMVAINFALFVNVLSVKAITEIATTAFISVEPNPAGVGQTVHITVWIEPAPPTSTDVFTNMGITIIPPNVDIDHIDPLVSDSNGSAYVEYVVRQVGLYTLQIYYPGQYFANDTVRYMPAMSPIMLLTVMQESVLVDQQIKINSDGSVNPPTAPISTLDNVTYTLTDDIYFNFSGSLTGGLYVERNDVIINGAGHTLQGLNVGCGITLPLPSSPNQHNVTIANITIKQFDIGIYVIGSLTAIVGNNIMNNSNYGVWIGNSIGNNITANNISGNGGDAVFLCESSYNNVIANNITNNGGDGIHCYSSGKNKINPGYNSISSNNIAGNSKGIYLFLCSNNNITTNNIANNRDHGVSANYSSGNIMYANSVKNNNDGFNFRYFRNNKLYENDVANNRRIAILLDIVYSTDIYANNITSNLVAVQSHGEAGTTEARGNTLFHNNFVNNTYQVFVYVNSNCTWDYGYPSGGNYWSDYNGTDANGDGIGDTPYIVSTNIVPNNIDHYPLMHPFGTETSPLPSPSPTSSPAHIPTPTPSPTPSPSSTPSPSPTPSPSTSPSPLTSPSEQPTESPQPQPTTPQIEHIYAAAGATAIAITTTTAVALKKRHHKNTN